MVYTKHACKQNLPDDGEDLDRENNKNRSVTRLNYSESAHFCKMARYEIGKQCDDDVLNSHFFQCDEKGGICEASHGNCCVIQGHDIDHHPCCNSCKKY